MQSRGHVISWILSKIINCRNKVTEQALLRYEDYFHPQLPLANEIARRLKTNTLTNDTHDEMQCDWPDLQEARILFAAFFSKIAITNPTSYAEPLSCR